MSFKSINLFVLLVLQLTIWSNLLSQKVTMHPDYASPLGTSLELSATFGDIRPNHFHMGVDFRTAGREGISIHSVREGYISRIKVSRTGYGKVLYVRHPNGYTSIYAHCSEFADFVVAYLFPIQLRNHWNELDIEVPKNKLRVKKGQFIAYSGNSGNSTGPHLHFEFRDNETEHALNPLLYLFQVDDSLAPIPQSLKMYCIDEQGYMFPGKEKIFPWDAKKRELKLKSNLITVDETFLPSNAYVAFAIAASDPMLSKDRTFGLYDNQLIVAGDTVFHSCLDHVSFDDSRYVNSYKDYVAYKSQNTKFHKLFRNSANPLSIYNDTNHGGIRPIDRDTLHLEVILSDANKHQTHIPFQLLYTENAAPKPLTFYQPKTHFIPDSFYRFSNQYGSIEIEPFTFYEPVQKSYSIGKKLVIGNSSTPIQRMIHLKMEALKTVSIDKQFIKSSKGSLATTAKGNFLFADSKNLGEFSVQVDTVAPIIKAHNFKESDTLIGRQKLSWKITDSQTEIMRYDIFVEGIWFPLEYDLKNDLITFKRNRFQINEQHIELRVTDSCGNTAFWCNSVCLSPSDQP